MKRLSTLVALALSIALAGSGTAAPGSQTVRSFTTTLSVNVPAIVWFGGPYCLAGHTLWSLSTEVCLDPIEYTCTEYWCTDPATGQSYRASMSSGVNPSCMQDGLQTAACSSTIEFPESRPTLKQLYDTLPMLYDKRYLNAPRLPFKR